MKNISRSDLIATGLAIFSMLFGAGNLIYPLAVGRDAGNLAFFGMIGFILTAVLLPVAGLVGMILFDGDYETYFNRLGKIPGSIFIGISMLIIGPGLVIPRITTLSHTMIAPFIPIPLLQEITMVSSFIFASIFLGVTFLATYRESKIIDLLGKIISPLLLISLGIIILWGLLTAQSAVTPSTTAYTLFKTNLIRGYETLDLLGTTFFASIVISILKQNAGPNYNVHKLAIVGLKAGLIGVSLLGIVYTGMSLLGLYHGHGLELVNPGELFREISFVVLGNKGALVIATAVLMACFSTAIALSAVVTEYIQKNIFQNKIGFIPALFITLVACLPLSIFGLDKVLSLTGGPLVYVGYPILITVTFCNIAYKLFGFKPVKLPVLGAFVFALISYLW